MSPLLAQARARLKHVVLVSPFIGGIVAKTVTIGYEAQEESARLAETAATFCTRRRVRALHRQQRLLLPSAQTALVGVVWAAMNSEHDQHGVSKNIKRFLLRPSVRIKHDTVPCGAVVVVTSTRTCAKK